MFVIMIMIENSARERQNSGGADSGRLSTPAVNGQVVVPAGGQVKVPTPRVDQVLFRVVPFLALASRMR